MPTLALLDGHSLAYRAFHALPTDLATPAGQVTNAVFGFTSMIIKLLGEEHPDAVAVAWDTPGATFRHEAYAEYKAQREAAPDLFRSQLPLMAQVADALRFRQVAMPGYEADDLIATIAKQATAEGWAVLVVTGDRDSFQLIGDGIRVMYLRRGVSDTVLADAAWVRERYGIPPDRYPDYAALRGDTSDNLPGVAGVGEKTATKLLQAYGSLEGIYEHLDEQTPRLKASLEGAKEQVFLNRRLSYLLDDVPIEVDADGLRMEPWDPSEVRRVFDELAFKSLWDRLVEAGGGRTDRAGEVLEVETRIVDGAEFRELPGPWTLDPVWDDDALRGLVAAVGDEEAWFLPAERLDEIAERLADPLLPKHLHDAKPLVRRLIEKGLDLQGLAFDVTLASYVINPGARTPELAEAAADVLDVEVDSVDAAAEEPPAQGTLQFGTGGGPDLDSHGRRAVAVARLVDPLRERVEARNGLDLLDEVELPLVRVLARMEVAGIAIDHDYLTGLSADLKRRIADCEGRVHELAGEPFNINSTLQLREVLFDRLGLTVLKKTPKGAPSTDASVLRQLAEENPIVDALLEYRELEKLRSTYVDGLLPLVAADGRIHATFNQTAASTGRLSSEHPNLQNIPVRSEEGRTIRRAFVASPGAVFVAADYSQIELRILAHLSGDPGLVEAFAAGRDIHAATAARVFATEEVTPEMRRRAKVINFGLLYGMEAYGFSQRLDIPQEEAEEHMAAYFAQFPAVKEFMDGIVDEARHTGYTSTILGRRRYLPELAAGRYRERQAGERMALNAPIQGSAADVIKRAMVELDEALERDGDRARMLVQVHDELLLEVPTDGVDHYTELTRKVMESVIELEVPLVVAVASGPDWASCKP